MQLEGRVGCWAGRQGARIQTQAHCSPVGVVGQSLPISMPQFPHLSLHLCVQKGVGWWGSTNAGGADVSLFCLVSPPGPRGPPEAQAPNHGVPVWQ